MCLQLIIGYYKNTCNPRRKYRRKKWTFSTEKGISDGNNDGEEVVGKQLVAEKYSDGVRRIFWRMRSVRNADTAGETADISDGIFRRKIRRKRCRISPKNFCEIFLKYSPRIRQNFRRNIPSEMGRIFFKKIEKNFCSQKIDSKFEKEIFFLKVSKSKKEKLY